MNLPELDRAVLARSLAQVARLGETYVPKTGQTGQTGQRIENAWRFGATPGQKLTSRPPKLASAYQKPAGGTVQQPNPAVQDVRTRIDSAYVRPKGVSQS